MRMYAATSRKWGRTKLDAPRCRWPVKTLYGLIFAGRKTGHRNRHQVNETNMRACVPTPLRNIWRIDEPYRWWSLFDRLWTTLQDRRDWNHFLYGCNYDPPEYPEPFSTRREWRIVIIDTLLDPNVPFEPNSDSEGNIGSRNHLFVRLLSKANFDLSPTLRNRKKHMSLRR